MWLLPAAAPLIRRAERRTSGDARLVDSSPSVGRASASCHPWYTSSFCVPARLHPAQWLWVISGLGKPTNFLAIQWTSATPSPTHLKPSPGEATCQACFLGHAPSGPLPGARHAFPSLPHFRVIFLSLLNNSLYESFLCSQ